MSTTKTVSVLQSLKSKGFETAVTAIREKLPFLAEAALMDLEANHVTRSDEYSTEENIAIEQAIEECWRRIERIRTEREDLR